MCITSGMVSTYSRRKFKRRARESNPQPVNRHLISNLPQDDENTEKTEVSQDRAAQITARGANIGSLASALQQIMAAWPSLPEAAKSLIVAIINQLRNDDGDAT